MTNVMKADKNYCFSVHGQRCPVNPGWVSLLGGGVRSLAPPPDEFSIPKKAWWASDVRESPGSSGSESHEAQAPLVVHQENDF